jgi:hypothetical protein
MRCLERIVMSSKPVRIALHLLVCCSTAGCYGSGPLVMRKDRANLAPWCGPNRRVEIGARVVGHVGFGEKRWKEWLVDDKGKEHDPEEIADGAWSYLERTGDAKRIEDAFSKDAYQATMTLVSINPVVVILDTFQDAAALKPTPGFAYEKWHWRAQVSAIRDPPFRDGLRWFSPDLKQRPTQLAFSADGVAEIRLPKGKLKLIRHGDKCETTRE